METLLEKVIGLDFKITGNGSRWRNTEEHSSLILDLQEQTWFWNSRGLLHQKPIEYLTKIKGISDTKAKELIRDLIYVGGGELSFPSKEAPVVQNEKLVDVFWKNGVKDRDYWYRRCLTDRTIDTFKLGKYDGFWTLPVYMDGKFMNFQCRTDTPEKKIRPWYRGVGPLLFNSSILSLVTEVFITEGPVDAILQNQLGLPSISHTGGSMGWNDKWFSYFKKQKTVYYVADNDLAGYNAVRKISKSLGEYRLKIITFLDYPLKYDTVKFFKDGGTLEKFKELIDKAVPGFKAKELCDYIKRKYPEETL
jgi:hypothetical protein